MNTSPCTWEDVSHWLITNPCLKRISTICISTPAKVYDTDSRFVSNRISRFTYEIAPVFVLMEQLTLKKMREIVGWPEGEGDGIFSPGERSRKHIFLAPCGLPQQWDTLFVCVPPMLRRSTLNVPCRCPQAALYPTCTAWWSPDTSTSPRSRPKAWPPHLGWSSSPPNTWGEQGLCWHGYCNRGVRMIRDDNAPKGQRGTE